MEWCDARLNFRETEAFVTCEKTKGHDGLHQGIHYCWNKYVDKTAQGIGKDDLGYMIKDIKEKNWKWKLKVKMRDALNEVYSTTYRKIFLRYNAVEALITEIKDAENITSVLDLGCGVNPAASYLPDSIHKVGVDMVKEHEITNNKLNKYYQLNILDIEKKFKKKSFDAVCAFGVIEHLEKEDGLKLMEMMENIASKKVIIHTPNGFLPQYDADNPYQNHRSGWETKEFEQRGYSVTGMHGWKKLRGEHATIKYKPKYFWIPFADFTQLFMKNRPEKAFQLFAIKDLDT